MPEGFFVVRRTVHLYVLRANITLLIQDHCTYVSLSYMHKCPQSILAFVHKERRNLSV